MKLEIREVMKFRCFYDPALLRTYILAGERNGLHLELVGKNGIFTAGFMPYRIFERNDSAGHIGGTRVIGVLNVGPEYGVFGFFPKAHESFSDFGFQVVNHDPKGNVPCPACNNKEYDIKGPNGLTACCNA